MKWCKVEGVTRTETDSFQWCSVPEPEAMAPTEIQEHQEKSFHCESDYTLAQVAQEGRGVFILGDFQKPSGHDPGQCSDPAWARGWTGVLQVPSHLSHSVTLGFFRSSGLEEHQLCWSVGLLKCFQAVTRTVTNRTRVLKFGDCWKSPQKRGRCKNKIDYLGPWQILFFPCRENYWKRSLIQFIFDPL